MIKDVIYVKPFTMVYLMMFLGNGTHKEHISGDNNIEYVRREVKKN